MASGNFLEVAWEMLTVRFSLSTELVIEVKLRAALEILTDDPVFA